MSKSIADIKKEFEMKKPGERSELYREYAEDSRTGVQNLPGEISETGRETSARTVNDWMQCVVMNGNTGIVPIFAELMRREEVLWLVR